jgi:hypothetical protein
LLAPPADNDAAQEPDALVFVNAVARLARQVALAPRDADDFRDATGAEEKIIADAGGESARSGE